MTKKDDFKDLIESIHYDAYYSCTPDVTSLRYNGPIPVFFWGNYSPFEKIKSIIEQDELKVGSDLLGYNANVKTKRGYYLFRHQTDNSQTKTSTWKITDVCFPSCSIVRNYLTGKSMECAPLQGRVVTVSLAALQFLDLYFDNGRSSFRQKVTLQPNAMDKEGKKAYMYVHNPAFFLTKEGETGTEWKEKQGSTLKPYVITIGYNKDKFYGTHH